MQAVHIHRFGGPDVMAIEEIDRPITTANEVVIKVFVPGFRSRRLGATTS